jgi:hypothetical protein
MECTIFGRKENYVTSVLIVTHLLFYIAISQPLFEPFLLEVAVVSRQFISFTVLVCDRLDLVSHRLIVVRCAVTETDPSVRCQAGRSGPALCSCSLEPYPGPTRHHLVDQHRHPNINKTMLDILLHVDKLRISV